MEPETGLITTQGELDRETTANYTVNVTKISKTSPIVNSFSNCGRRRCPIPCPDFYSRRKGPIPCLEFYGRLRGPIPCPEFCIYPSRDRQFNEWRLSCSWGQEGEPLYPRKIWIIILQFSNDFNPWNAPFSSPSPTSPPKKEKKKEEGKITSHVSGVAALIRYNVIGSIPKNKILNSNCYYLRLKQPLFIFNSQPQFLWYSRLFGSLHIKPITQPYESCYLTQATCRFLFNVLTVLYFG